MSMLGALSQLSVAEAVAVPAAAGVVSALQFSSASTVYASGQVIEGTGSMLSVTVMVCKQSGARCEITVVCGSHCPGTRNAVASCATLGHNVSVVKC